MEFATGASGVTVDSAGTVELTGANSYTGVTYVESGVLEIAKSATIDADDELSIASGATAQIYGQDHIGALYGSGTLVDATAALYVGDDNATSTFNGLIRNGSTAGALYKVGSGTLTLTDANTFTGGVTLTGGVLSISNMSALGTGVVAFLGANDALQSTATGTLANSILIYSGVSATVEATAGKALTLSGGFHQSTASASSIHFGSTTDTGTIELATTGSSVSADGNASVDGGELLLGDALAATLLGDFSAVTVGSSATAATLDLGGLNATVFNLAGASSGVITDNGAAATLTIDEGSSTTFSGVLQNGTGALSLSEVSTVSSTLTLTKASTYTGATNIGANQTLALSGAGSIADTAISVGQGATFDISGLTAATASVLNLSGVGAVNVDGKSLTVTAATGSPSLLFEGSTGTAASHISFDSTATTFSLANALFSNWASTHSSILIYDAQAGATIVGSSQNETIYGASGDTLTGGAGVNGFMFAAAPTSQETINDFSAAQGDYIGISHTGFSALGLTAGEALPNADFTVGSAAVGTNAQFVWNSAELDALLRSRWNFGPDDISGGADGSDDVDGVESPHLLSRARDFERARLARGARVTSKPPRTPAAACPVPCAPSRSRRPGPSPAASARARRGELRSRRRRPAAPAPAPRAPPSSAAIRAVAA